MRFNFYSTISFDLFFLYFHLILCKSYHEEKGEDLQEECIFDAAIEDKQTVSQLASSNREQQIEQQIEQKEDVSTVIASSSEEEDTSVNGEFDPFYFILLYYPSVVFIKLLPPYESLPLSYRSRKLLPPKAPGIPEYTLVYFFSFLFNVGTRSG